jgi:hypothetical protein
MVWFGVGGCEVEVGECACEGGGGGWSRGDVGVIGLRRGWQRMGQHGGGGFWCVRVNGGRGMVGVVRGRTVEGGGG